LPTTKAHMNNFFNNLPPLIYGTAWKKEKTAELVEKAVLHGFRGIDTACQPKHYNEAGVGEALQRLKKQGIAREALFLQTKFTPLSGQDPASVPYDPTAPIGEQVRQSSLASLKNLGVDYIDALLLHSPLSSHAQTMQAWRAMEELHQQGVVHRLGISNCYELAALQSIYNEATVEPSILQNRFYADTDYDKMMRIWCREKKISYQSFWTLTANPHILRHPLLHRFALARSVTGEQLFFRFLTQQQILPLIGTCSEKHMQEDLSIFDFTLTDDEINQINSLFL
jgi:diketogulonate reductase-like aldo/keto reductase